MKKIVFAGLLAAALAVGAGAAEGISADAAWELLKQGNERFVGGKVTNENHTTAIAAETAKRGQHPSAVVLTCGDSRVPPEVIFDRGIGDIFVVRVAGNIAGAIETASIDYGVEHAGANLVVVLGHTHCGAVQAAIAAPNETKNPLLVAIQPTIKKLKNSIDAENLPDELLARLVEWGNVQAQTDAIKKLSPVIKKAAESGKISREHDGDGQFRLVQAMYDIETGKVEWAKNSAVNASVQPDATPAKARVGRE
ncbi:MAG: carbonic anhydrase [Planctomycetota bacterium]|nr:carbonic anhydrase [Planctomycetota bacterium]